MCDMCIPVTVSDVDFFDTALCGDDLLQAVQDYAVRVMDEAYDMDCHVTEGTSNGCSLRYQRCAEAELKKRLGEGMTQLRLPPLRGTGHAAGRRIYHFRGGM